MKRSDLATSDSRMSYPVRRKVVFFGAASPPRQVISRARRKSRYIQGGT